MCGSIQIDANAQSLYGRIELSGGTRACALQKNRVDLLYLTDRMPVSSAELEIEYSAKRSASVGFGEAVVEIGDGLTWLEMERIHIIAHSRGTDVVTTALRELIIACRAGRA